MFASPAFKYIAKIIADESIHFLANKHNVSVDFIRKCIVDGNEVIIKQVQKLIEQGIKAASEIK